MINNHLHILTNRNRGKTYGLTLACGKKSNHCFVYTSSVKAEKDKKMLQHQGMKEIFIFQGTEREKVIESFKTFVRKRASMKKKAVVNMIIDNNSPKDLLLELATKTNEDSEEEMESEEELKVPGV